MRMQWAVLATLAVLVCGGCSDATITKIPSRSDYKVWTDEDQKRVDCIPGMRFYRTRPYVVVKKPFVVESETILVDALTSPDGKFVRIVGVKGQDAQTAHGRANLRHWWAKIAAGGVDPANMEYSLLIPSGGGTAGADAQGATGETIDPAALDNIAPHATQEDRPTGTATMKLSTNQKAVAQHELNSHLDLVYLPDFSEQYVVNPRANLGDINLSFTQGPGGELLAMGMRVDNSAVTAPLVEAYTKVVESGGTALQEAIGKGTPGGPGVAQGSTAAAPQRGAIITLRVHVVSMATVGIYPILKESEMMENRHCVRQFGRCGCDACTQGQLKRATHVVPIYPFSRVAYQVHKTVLVENLISASGDPSRSLPGFAQGAETNAAPAAAAGLATSDLEKLLNNYLKGFAPTTCVRVSVVSREPPGPAVPINTLLLKVLDKDGTALPPTTPCVTQVVNSLSSPDARAQIKQLTGTRIVAGN